MSDEGCLGEDDAGGNHGDSALRPRGRNRFCKQCRFSCSDAKEFLNHQKFAHSQEKDPDILSSISKRRKSSNANNDKNNQQFKRQSPRINGSLESSPTEIKDKRNSPSSQTVNSQNNLDVSDTLECAIYSTDQDIEKMESLNSEVMLTNEQEEHDDEGRLIIAEEENLIVKQPTRSGNIQNRTYVCNQCDFSSTSAKTFLHHQKDEHSSDIIIYECDICEYATKYKQKLPRHRKLHFTGKDSSMLSGSDLENSFSEKERSGSFNDMIRNSEKMDQPSEQIPEDDEEEELEEEEEEEDGPIPDSVDTSTPTVEKKKRKTRQEVDPGKYFEVLDETGIKYACSKCGNVYKWRKSLNKHWKEKHFGDIPDASHPPPGLAKLNSLTHVKYRFPANGMDGNHLSRLSHKGNRSRSETPVSMVAYNGHNEQEVNDSVSSVVMPKFIGPFITNTIAYPSGSQKQQASVMDAPSKVDDISSKPSLNSREEQPIDFSVRKGIDVNQNSIHRSMQIPLNIKTEPQWNDFQKFGGKEQMVAQDLSSAAKGDDQSPVLQCNRCGFVAKTLVDYSSHMTLHLNKRAFKCAECQEHFNNVEDLNKHFAENHAEKIHEHKEAIQKIPHGLQQTYHLLKMPLNAIGAISTHESQNGAGEPKYLKCSMCHFVAKWPAELQKHAVSHSEERPFICMVCGSTYKWKWDLVKHFEKSHNSLPNPYKRREQGSASNTPTSKVLTDSKPPLLKIPAMMSSMNANIFGSQPPLYPMTSTAAALIDTETFPKRVYESFSDEEPLKKKRRLSDTDMPIHDNHNTQDGREMFITAGALETDEPKRPSSEPSASKAIDMFNTDTDSDSGMKVHSMSALKDMENLIPSEDDDNSKMDESDMVNSKTQIAMKNSVKKRMETGPNCTSPSNKGKISEKAKTGTSDILLPYKCQMCEYRARWPSEITQHMKNHSDEKPYHCPRCSYKSKWKWDVVKHLKRCGGGTIKDVIDTNKLKRLAPPNVTVMPQGAFQHPSQTSPSVGYQQSQTTGKQSEGYSISSVAEALTSDRSAIMAMADMGRSGFDAFGKDYEREMIARMNTDGMDKNQVKQTVFRSLVNQGMYHCLECPFVAHSPAELRRHGVLHSENKPFSCSVCGYSSRWKCDLKKHMKTYGHYDPLMPVNSNNQPTYLQDKFRINQNDQDQNSLQSDQDKEERMLYKCNRCPYVTYKKFSYDAHVKIHGDVKKEDGGTGKFKCKQCEYQAEDLSSFLQHKKMHASGQNPGFPGNLDQTSNQDLQPQEQVSNRTLQKHRRKPVQQFKCSKCPYTCFKRSGLSMHEAMHEPRGDEAFCCHYCDYNVYSKSLLVQHMKLHPEFEPSDCPDILGRSENESNGMDEDYYGMDEGNMEDEYNEDCLIIDEDSQHSMDTSNREMNAFSMCESGSAMNGDISDGALDLSSQSFSHDMQIYGNNRNSTPKPSSVYGRSMETNNSNPALRFPCEWCTSKFPNLVTLYQHANAIHPSELRAQEMGETPASTLPTRQHDPYLERQKRLQQKQEMMLQQQRQQQQQKQQHQKQQLLLERQQQQSYQKSSMNQQSRYRPIEPKPTNAGTENTITKHLFSNFSKEASGMLKMPQDTNNNSKPTPLQNTSSALVAQSLLAKAKKSTSPNKRGRSFQCTKCSFTAPNAVTYLRHIERHGSNCRHTCRFCDYSIDRLNLLYQHMKGTHGDKWRGTPEEKINLTSKSSHSDDSPKLSLMPDLNSESLNNSYDGSFTGSLAETSQDYDNMEETISSSLNEWKMYMDMGSKGQKPVLTIKEETTWRGTPIQICTINGRKNYKCPKCLYVNSNASNTTNHIRQHGTNRKYKCEKCDYSLDNIKLIYHHMETIHSKDPVFIERSPAKIPYIPEESSSIEENNNSLLWSDNQGSLILPTCTKCPYKCRTVEMLQIHIKMHDSAGEFKCEYCDFSIDSQTDLVKHLVVHREPYEPDLEENNKEEQMTNKNEQNPDDFFSKIELMPNNTNKIVANETKTLTSQHLKNVLNKVIHNSGRLRYKCARCPYFSYCKSNIIKHRKQHVVKSRYQCNICDYSAARAFLLQQHMKFHENAVDTSKQNLLKGDNFHDIVLDPYDEDGHKVLRNLETIDGSSNIGGGDTDYEKDFSDEDGEFGENEFDENVPDAEFDEEEMAAMEKAEFEGLNQGSVEKRNKSDENSLDGGNESDESLSEIDPSALQQQMSMNLSGNVISDEEKIRYSCSLCPYRCNALRSFKCHIHMHGLNKKYICNFCNWSADRLNLLYQHRKVHAKLPGFDPNPEDIIFLNRNYALENDTKNSQDTAGFIYRKADMPGDEKSLQRMSDRSFSGKRIYSCKLCPFSCNNKNSFAYHKSLHKISARYTCTECSYSVDRWNLLSQHMKLHKQENEMSKLHDKNGYMSPEMGLGELKNYEPSSPEVEPQLYFNSTGSPLETDSEHEHDKSEDLNCERCPYSTPSKDELAEHENQHNIRYRHNCPYCDYSAPVEQQLLEHVQLHFPSTNIDFDTFKTMLAKRGEKVFQTPEVPVVRSSKVTNSEQIGEPDSTTTSEQNVDKEGLNSGAEGNKTPKVLKEKEKSRLKVYVCQYCEREFEGKNLMLQHERQHLIGSKF